MPSKPPPPVKPRLRGRSHQFAAIGAVTAGVVLVAMTTTPLAAIASGVYAVTLALMFGISALYHRIDWDPVKRARMRRLDHAAIFLIIAGTYTPLALLAIGGAAGRRLLVFAWTGALAGMLQSTLWVQAPRAVTVVLYCGLGWLGVAFYGDLRAEVGTAQLMLLLAGGVLYTAGAIIYALRRPDPRPAVFGYHEIFHALTIAASMCHFAVVILVVRASR